MTLNLTPPRLIPPYTVAWGYWSSGPNSVFVTFVAANEDVYDQD